jgi:hypothetical protein
MIGMLRIYSKGLLENVTIEELLLRRFFYPVADIGLISFSSLPSSRSSATSNS